MKIDGIDVWTYDIEVFPNAFFATFFDGVGWITFDHTNIKSLNMFIDDPGKILAGFNSFSYDDVMLKYIYLNIDATPDWLYKKSCSIIVPRSVSDEQAVFKMRYSETPWAFSVDVFKLLNEKNSLKEWACRERMEVVADSPHRFDADLPASGRASVLRYNRNDVKCTYRLLEKYWGLVELRTKLSATYKLGKRPYVLTEAQLAQHTLMTLHKKRTGQFINKVRDAAKCNPDNVRRTYPLSELISPKVRGRAGGPLADVIQDLKYSEAKGDKTGGRWTLSGFFHDYKKPIRIGQKSYQLGVGGLHSVDTPDLFKSNIECGIVDLDVTSYYPSIIINDNLHPRHLGTGFVKDLAALRDARLKAKKEGDNLTNEALKIVINSTFGKLNDIYSPLRSIPDAMRVTINGQLFLLMLIEMLEDAGADIISANTDGVTIGVNNNNPRWRQAVRHWESATGFNLEEKRYKVYARRDVNSYIALAEDGSVKYKGAFNPEPLIGKWDGRIVKKAAKKYLLEGIDPKETVEVENDPTAFLFYQRCKNGGSLYIDDIEVGKTARWYISLYGGQLRRKNPKGTFAKIPNGTGAKLAMDITDWTILDALDVDRLAYVEEAWALIRSTDRIDK